MTEGSALFLDTSIQIARTVHGPETKKRIENRLAEYDLTVSSEVVKQEFKRRLLKEAQYLLNQLNKLGSIEKVHRHVVDILPPQQNRKRNICLDTLSTIWEGRADEEITDRAKRYLRNLIKFGLEIFEDEVGSLVRDVGCACSRNPIVERKPYRDYDFGTDHCSKTKGACGVTSFLRDHREVLVRILDGLNTMPPEDKTKELNSAQEFIELCLEDPDRATVKDPCLKVGDLIIALESLRIPAFYTLNVRESKHLCRWLKQDLIVRPKNPVHDDIVCLNLEPEWESKLS